MLKRRMIAIAATGLLVIASAIAGCGGSSNSTSASNVGTDGGSTQKVADPSEATGSTDPRNKYMKFGTEASEQERGAASAVLAKNLKAREEGDWRVQCATLAPDQIKLLAKPSALQHRKSSCAEDLKALAQPLSGTKEARSDNLSGSITALRMKGDRAFAVFLDAEGQEYVMPMKKVAGQWKVNALLTSEVQ